MISEVVMPQMGADMTEGTVLRWLKHEGDGVERGEIIAEIETDKANIEIEAFEGGTFRTALAAEGEVVHVGEVIAVIADPADDISKYGAGTGAPRPVEAKASAAGTATAAPPAPPPPVAPAPQEASPTIEAQPEDEQPPTPAPPPGVHHAQPTTEELQAGGSTNGRLRASPVARRIARERGIDLHQVRGSGPDGRILRSDVEQFTGAAPRPAPAAAPPRPATPSAAPRTGAPAGEVVQMSRMRQAIARRMSQSKREAPHYYLLVDIDMSAALDLRRQINDAIDGDEAARVSINDLIVRACALALQRYPAFNATMEGEQVMRHDAQNVCIAIAMDDGLIAPAVLDAGRKTVTQIAGETKDLVGRAKGGSLKPEEMSAGTFSITNLGAYGIETLIGIIQPPQTAILGVGSVMEQPVAVDGVVGTRQMMKVALSADHRVTDGAQGAQFLGEIKRLLEKPVLLLV